MIPAAGEEYTPALPPILGSLGCGEAELFVLHALLYLQEPLTLPLLVELAGPLWHRARPMSPETLRDAALRLLASGKVYRKKTNGNFLLTKLWQQTDVRTAVLRYGAEHGWTPSEALAKKMLTFVNAERNEYARRLFVSRKYNQIACDAAFFAGDVSELMNRCRLRFRLGGDSDASQSIGLYLQGMSDLVSPHGDDAMATIPPAIWLFMLPFRIFRAFLCERECGPLLDSFAGALETDLRFQFYCDAMHLVGAVCVWMGDAARLARFDDLAQQMEPEGRYKRVYDFYQHCLAGRFEEAGGMVIAPLRSSTARAEASLTFTHLSLPSLALAVPLGVRWRASETALLRSGRMMDSLESEENRDKLLDIPQELSRLLPSSSPYIHPSLRTSFFASTAMPYFLRLLAENRLDPRHEETVPSIVENALERAAEASKKGYPFLAAAVAGLCLWSELHTETAKALLATLGERGFRPLWPLDPPPPLWREVMSDIEKTCTPQGAEKEAGHDGTQEQLVRWHLAVQGRSKNIFFPDSLSFTLHKRLKSGKWGYGKHLSMQQCSTLPAECFPTEAEKNLLRYVRLMYDAHPYHSTDSIDAESLSEALSALAGVPEVYLTILDSVRRMVRQEFGPVEITRTEATFRTKRSPDGSLTLVPPEGGSEDYPFLRKLGEKNYEIVSLAKGTKRLLDVLQRHGLGDGKPLVVPADGAADASRILCAVARTVPMTGAITADGDTADLPHVPADGTLHARLAFQDDVLEVALRVQPIPASGQWTEPGRGEASPVGRAEGVATVYVRDLDAEHREADTVREALAAYPDARMDDCLWRFESLAQALEALDALYALAPPLVLDWREGSNKVRIEGGSGRLRSNHGADYWFEVEGEFQLDTGKLLSFLDVLRHLPKRSGRYIPLDDGTYLRVTQSMMRRLEALQAAGSEQGNGLRIGPAAVPMLEAAFHAPGDDDREEPLALPPAMEEAAERFREAFAEEVSVPETLTATLRPYQETGYRWLSRFARCGIGACLADDMGLGKTVQIIALLLERAQDGPSLVVAPASVCGNWAAEIRRFAPTLRAVQAHAEGAEAADEAGSGDVVLVSYGLVVSRQEQFEAREWNGIVLDEAQAIKNHVSMRARAVKKLRGAFRVIATGTPVENRLSELWSLFDFLNPGLLLSHDRFLARFTQDGQATEGLKKLVAPLILRRLKREVLTDLPEKTEIVLPVELGDDERHAYESCRLNALERLEGDPEAAGNRISILAELTKLRRFCCHPSLVVPTLQASAKLDALQELLENLHENGHKALVFSQFTDYLAIVQRMIEGRGWRYEYLDGSVPVRERMRRVEGFQAGKAEFFLISLKAGGTGLNLTAANYVILLDPWWNPAVEDQAADRAHRIGQRAPVTVYRLVAQGTVEEKVLALHEEKRKMAADLLDGVESAKGAADLRLTPEELMGLLRSPGEI